MFKNNLRYYRLQKQLRKKELAKQCDVSPMCITNYEKGTRKPGSETLTKLAKALGTTVDALLAEHENELNFNHDDLPLTKKESNKVWAQVESVYHKITKEAPDYLDLMPKLLKLKKVEQLAPADLRKRLKATPVGPIGDLISLIEKAGIQVLPIDTDIYPSGTINGNAYIGVNMQNINYTQVICALYRLFCTKVPTKMQLYKLALSTLISDEELVTNLQHKRSNINKDFYVLACRYCINFNDLLKHAEYNKVITNSLRIDTKVDKKFIGYAVSSMVLARSEKI